MSKRNPKARIRRELVKARAVIVKYQGTEATTKEAGLAMAILRGLEEGGVHSDAVGGALLLAYSAIQRSKAKVMMAAQSGSAQVH